MILSIRYFRHLHSRCGLKITNTQCDLMVFGLCVYGRLPRHGCDQLHITAGVWKSQVFGPGGQMFSTVILRKHHNPPKNPTFYEDVRYRVKPEPRQPREWWDNVNVYGAHTGIASGIVRYDSKKEADKCASLSRVECIHVREVIDGEGA